MAQHHDIRFDDKQTNRAVENKSLNRNHVKGTSGPGRNDLPTYVKLDHGISEAVLKQAREIATSGAPSDFNTDRYKISRKENCELANMVPENYKLLLLQQQAPDTDQDGEISYTDWRDGTSEIQKYLEDMFGTVYQTRLTITPPGAEIPWHIDLNTSVICRVQIGVDMDDSEFEFRRRGKESSIHIDSGDMWFLNTAWNHRVLNTASAKPRVVLITEVLYDDLKPYL
jgi:hypothetical protein